MPGSRNVQQAADTGHSAAAATEPGPGDRFSSSVALWKVALRLLRMMQKRRRWLALSVTCATLSALLSLTPYIAVALALLELMAPAPDWRALQLIGLLGVAGVLLDKSLFGLATYLSHRIAFSTQRDLRFTLAEKLARVPLAYADALPKGSSAPSWSTTSSCSRTAWPISSPRRGPPSSPRRWP